MELMPEAVRYTGLLFFNVAEGTSWHNTADRHLVIATTGNPLLPGPGAEVD